MNNARAPQFDLKCEGSRWVAYFDLLGMRARLCERGHMDVFHAYQHVIERLERDRQSHSRVQHTWFSDTFLLATVDDSVASFTELEQVSRWLFYFMLQARIPLRGAIACGSMYADFEHSVFVGDAMIEAYDYGEGQDWIGLILCPSAATAMDILGVPVEERLRYAWWEPVWKREPPGAPARIGACVLGNWGSIHGQNDCLEVLQSMARDCPDEARQKYDRTIAFLQGRPRRIEPGAGTESKLATEGR